MSQIGPGSTKTANAHVNPPPALGWDVFVTPRMPIVTPDRPPGARAIFSGDGVDGAWKRGFPSQIQDSWWSHRSSKAMSLT